MSDIRERHDELDFDGMRFRYGHIPPCGNPRCACAGTGSIAVYAALQHEDRWFGLVTLDPRESTAETLLALREGGEEWDLCRSWLENDSALYGVPWENVLVSDEAPRHVMLHQQHCSLGTPRLFRSQPVDQVLRLRRHIADNDPRAVRRMLEIIASYCARTQ